MSELEQAGRGGPSISRRTVLRGAAGVGAVAALGTVAAACGGAAASPSAASSAPATAGPTSAPTAVPSAAPSTAAATPAPTEPPATPAPSPESELFIYNWADYIGDKTIADFEAKYGIKVTYDYFDNVDTQYAKISQGNSGYDITFPTSTYIAGYVAQKLVQPLDLTLIPNLANLAPEWQHPVYDPGNANSIPYFWWTTGIAYDAEKVPEGITSWAALWDAKWAGHMAMLDDYRECFAAALIRLGHDVNTTDEAQLDAALALLQEQKKLLRTYTTDDIGALSTGDAWVMQAWGADVYQVRPDRPSVTYVIPSEGAVRGSDTMVLLAGAKHPIAAHLFMNYMLDAQVAANNTNYTGYMGPNEAAQQYIDPAILADQGVNPSPELIAKLQEIRDLGDKEKLYSSRWTKLRAGA